MGAVKSYLHAVPTDTPEQGSSGHFPNPFVFQT